MKEIIINNAMWVIVQKTIGIIVQIISLPLLLNYFGAEKFGLFVIVVSLNGYLGLLTLGAPSGLVRYFALWSAKSETGKIRDGFQSGLTFFSFVGIVNAVVFLLMAYKGFEYFNIETTNIDEFRHLCFASAFLSLLTWPSTMFEYLLRGYEKIDLLMKIDSFSPVIRLIGLLVLVNTGTGLVVIYIWNIFSILLFVPVKMYYSLKIFKGKRLFNFGWNYKVFKPALVFSLQVFAMGIAIASITQLRPIILGIRSTDGIQLAAYYHILFTFSQITFLISPLYHQTLLPTASKYYAIDKEDTIEKIAFTYSKYYVIVQFFILGTVILLLPAILKFYLGKEYLFLCLPIQIFLIIHINRLHSSITPLALASGNIKIISYYLPTVAFIALIIMWFSVEHFGLYGLIAGTFFYNIADFLFFMVYYFRKVIPIDIKRLLKENYIVPLMVSVPFIILAISVKVSASISINLSVYLIFLIINIVVFWIPLKKMKVEVLESLLNKRVR